MVSIVFVWLTVVTGGKVFILDLAAKIDQCAEYICKQQWGDLEFPPPFGREAYPEVMLCICSRCIQTLSHSNGQVLVSLC